MQQFGVSAASVNLPSYMDDDVHRHQLDGSQVDSTLLTVPKSSTETRQEQCNRLLSEFCSVNNVAYLITIDNGNLETQTFPSSVGSAAAVHPYGLLYITANQKPSAKLTGQLMRPEYNVYIVISECRLYPELIEAIVRACPRVRYWDAVNSSVLSPRVVSAWQRLIHLNTLKLSLLNCMDRAVCRAQLMHWPTNHLQRLMILGDSNHHKDIELHDTIVKRYPYLVHFANTALYTPYGGGGGGGATDGVQVHLASPSYEVCPKPWARSVDDEAAAAEFSATLTNEFHKLQIQIIGAQALVAEVCV